MRLVRNIAVASMALLFGFTFTSCEKEKIEPGTTSSQNQKNSFQVRMTDAPGDYEALDIELTRVDVYLEGSGWVNLSNSSQMVSVLELTNGAETEIAFNSNVEAGTYSQLRLTFGSDNSLELNSSSELGLELPLGISAQGTLDLALASEIASERTVVIEIDETVSATSGASILLDFDVAASVIETSENWILNPAIRVVTDLSTGAMGEVEGSQQASILFSNNQSSFEASTMIDSNGEFMLQGLEEGSYTVTINAEVEGQANNEVITLNNVVIVEGRIENLGTIEM